VEVLGERFQFFSVLIRQVVVPEDCSIDGSSFPVVSGTTIIEGKLRLFVIDGSYIDVWLAKKSTGNWLK